MFNGMAEEMVNQFNAAMPPKGPIFIYTRLPDQVCGAAITICSGDITLVTHDGRHPIGLTWPGESTGHARVVLDQVDPRMDPFAARQWVLCHEMMHAATGIGDNEGAVPDDSCMWGWRTNLGSFDVHLLYQTYGDGSDYVKHRKKEMERDRHKKNR
jgi:hypothetical protein